MITFVLAAAVLVGALWIAVALDGATTGAPPGVVAHVLAARLLATDQTVPVAWGMRLAEELDAKIGHEPASARSSKLGDVRHLVADA
jgi:hypothetical protein